MFRFKGQLKVVQCGFKPCFLCFFNGPEYRTFAPVVRKQSQVPIAMHVIEIRKVVQCSAGGGHQVPSFINPFVLFQVKLTSRAGNKLPQTLSG